MRAPKFMAAIATCLAACGSPSGVGAEPADSPASAAEAGSAALTMRVARAAHASATLADGRILLIGGCVRESCEAGSDSGTVEVFNPRSRRFQRAGTLLRPRVSTTAAALPNDRVFIAGGWVGSTVTDSTETFDAKSGRSRAGGNLSSPRADMAIAVLRDGRVMLAGGFDGHNATAAIDVFNPKDGLVRRVGTLATARAGAGAALLPDGKVLVAGGGINGATGLHPTATAEIVDPATGFSRMTGSLAEARYKHAMVALPTGPVLVIGGSDERDSRGKLNTVESYNAATGRFKVTGRMLNKRYKISNSVVVLPRGRVLIAGGAPRAEVYDSATHRTRHVGPDFGGSLNFATASLLPGGSVLVAGGYYEDGIRMSRLAWVLR